MKGGPSIAVMLGEKPSADEDGGEPGLSEAKASAMDASKALASAVASKDADGIYRAFRSLMTLCKEVDDLEDSGESEEAEEPAAPKDEAESEDE